MRGTMFIDTVANRLPSRGVGNDHRHCARISAAVMSDKNVLLRQEFLIRPDDWDISDNVQPFLRATPEDFDDVAVSTRLAFERMVPLLRETNQFIAFNASYHRATLEALCRDNGCSLTDFTHAPWRCLMTEAAPILGVRGESSTRWKSPKLSDAYQYFTGREWVEKTEWDEFASQQIFALRHILIGITDKANA